MNRELKFRVWDATDKEYNYDIVVGNILSAIHGSGDPLSEEEEEQFTLQQYTGLKDKNGVEIYEGDFIQYQYPTNDDCIKLKTKNIVLVRWTTEEEDNHPGFRIVDLWGQYGEMEVIGNNMENPELLKA
jgi:uncharacterized phage protein (TIGR01671 family)